MKYHLIGYLTLSVHAQEGYISHTVCHALILEITDNYLLI